MLVRQLPAILMPALAPRQPGCALHSFYSPIGLALTGPVIPSQSARS